MKIVHLRFNLSSTRNTDEIDELVNAINAIDGIVIRHLIVSERVYVGGVKIALVEIESDNVESTLDTDSDLNITSIYGTGATALGTITSWITKYKPESYLVSIADESIVDALIKTIKDKTKNVGVKTALVTTGAKAVVGNFKLDDIPYDKETYTLL